MIKMPEKDKEITFASIRLKQLGYLEGK